MKKIFQFIIIAIVFIGIGYGVSALTSSEITYKSTTVEGAIDDLYTKANSGILTGFSAKIKAQTYYNYDAGAYMFMNDYYNNYTKFKITSLVSETNETDKCVADIWSVSLNNYFTPELNTWYVIRDNNGIINNSLIKITTKSSTTNKLAQCTAFVVFEK